MTDQGPGPGRPLVARDDAGRQRYEALLDGDVAGVLTYRVSHRRIALIHTEVQPGFEGRGVGAGLVRFALVEARRRGLLVIATCPYVKRYLERHPEDHDIVVGMTPR